MNDNEPEEEATLDQLYYILVREMGYTWKQVMAENVPQSLYSFERLQIEGEKKKERREEMEEDVEQAKNQAP